MVLVVGGGEVCPERTDKSCHCREKTGLSHKRRFLRLAYISFLDSFGVNIPEVENAPGDQQRSEKGTGQRPTSSFKYRRRSQPEDPVSHKSRAGYYT
jgi:hypothetical protein